MEVVDITWNPNEEINFLDENNFDDYASYLDTIKNQLEDQESIIDDELNIGGLNAASLNFDGFSPLCEMGMSIKNNLRMAIEALNELKSMAKDDMLYHMTNEWGKHYQEAYYHLEELRETYNNHSNDDSNKNQAYQEYEDYKDIYESIKSKYESLAGQGSASNALNINFVEASKQSIGREIIGSVSIPSDVRQGNYTVTTFDTFKWSHSATGQGQIYDLWVSQGKPTRNGLAYVNVCGEDRYLIATTTALGKTGDMVDLDLKNGQTLKCLITDIKNPNDSNYSKYGHTLTDGSINVLEFEVTKEAFDSHGRQNPSTSVYNLEWDSTSPVTTVNSRGSIFKNGDINTFADDINSSGGSGRTTNKTYSNLNGIRTSNSAPKTTNIVYTSKNNNSQNINDGVSFQPTGNAQKDAIAWGKSIAEDNRYGYKWGGGHNGDDGSGGYNCSGLICNAYINAGILPKGKVIQSAQMPSQLPKYGFEYVGNASKSYEGLQPGDILVKPGSHVEMYVGNGKVLGARGDYDKSPGDSSGGEISVRKYGNSNWNGYLIYRYTGN